MNPCLLVPIHDHGSSIRRVVEPLASSDLTLVTVNDGSDPSARTKGAA